MNQLNGIELIPVCKEDLPTPGGNIQEDLKGFRCGGGRSSFSVVWRGILQPCLTYDGIQVDLKDKTFDSAWEQINQAVNEHLIPRECSGCPYEAFCTVCVAEHAAGAPLGHANPKLCDKARRFIMEGLVALPQS